MRIRLVPAAAVGVMAVLVLTVSQSLLVGPVKYLVSGTAGGLFGLAFVISGLNRRKDG